VPLSVALITTFFGRTVQIPTSLVAKVLGFSVIAALILGVIVKRLAPSFERFAKPLSKLATAIVLLAMVPILLTTWRAIVREIGDFTIVAIALFTLAGLAVGHLLGGPDSEDRTVLALSTASRHPGVALALAGAVAEDKAAVSAAVLLAVLVTSVVTVPYVKWRRRIHAPPRGVAEGARG